MCPCTCKANALLRCREQHAQAKGRTRRVELALWLQAPWHNERLLKDALGWWMLWAGGYFEERGASICSQILVINFVFLFCLIVGVFSIYFEKSMARTAAVHCSGCSAATNESFNFLLGVLMNMLNTTRPRWL